MGTLSKFEDLPLGFRFKPTDVELIDHYLRLKINGRHNEVSCIQEIDICSVEPWDLPALSAIKTYDHEWFFFCPRDRKYASSLRSNRATEKGYWKATGKDRTIKSRSMGLIGTKKTLVFYKGRAPKGERTSWVIHEYRPTLQELDGTNPGQEAYILCRLFKKDDDLKQDEIDDIPNIDVLENDVSVQNQTSTLVLQDDLRSEAAGVQASPVSVEQPVMQPETAVDDIDYDCFFNFEDYNSLFPSPRSSEFGTLGHNLTEGDTIMNADLMACKKESVIEAESFIRSKNELPKIQPYSGVTGLSEQPIPNSAYPNDEMLSADDINQLLNFSPIEDQLSVAENISLVSQSGDYDFPQRIMSVSDYQVRSVQPMNFLQLQGTALRQSYESGVLDTIPSDEDVFSLDELISTPPEAEDEKLLVNDELDFETGIVVKKRSSRMPRSRGNFNKQGTAPQRLRLRRSSFKSLHAEKNDRSSSEEVSLQSGVDLSNRKRSMILVFMFAFLFMACIGLWTTRKAVSSVS